MSTGPVCSCASTLAQAFRRLARHPAPVCIVCLGVAGGLLPGSGGLAGHILAGAVAGLLGAGLAGVVVWLVRASRGGLVIAVQRHPAPPYDMSAALRLAEVLLASIQPGPETIRAADPAATHVRWHTGKLRDEENPDPARVDKMRVICSRFRREAVVAGVLHQMPQILLVADDGTVIKLFSSSIIGDTGVVSPVPAESIPVLAQ